MSKDIILCEYRRVFPVIFFCRASNPMGSMGSFGIPPSRYGSQGAVNNFHSVFGSGGGGDTSTPPLLDLSEFPSLTNRGQGDSMPQPSPMPGKQPYGLYLTYIINFKCKRTYIFTYTINRE